MFLSRMNFSRITYTTADRKALITLNRPDKRNALDDGMVMELTTAFTTAGRDPAVKVVLLAAKGPSFCAGADLDYLARVSQFDLEENRQDSFRMANLFRVVHELRKPVIAMVDGPALGGGAGLASVCDFIIASKENAQFGYPEVRVGFIPAIVLVFLIKRVGEGRARELVLRGAPVDADEAFRIGLASMVVQAGKLGSTTDALVRELIQKNSGNAMGLCKEMLSKLHGMNMPDALDFAANLNAAARMTVECRTGIGAFLRKEKMEW
jgi:methylglutaconyl-CoA hydratase